MKIFNPPLANPSREAVKTEFVGNKKLSSFNNLKISLTSPCEVTTNLTRIKTGVQAA